MMKSYLDKIVHEEAGGGKGGSGGSLLTTPSNDGGGSPAPKGGADSGSGASGGGTPQGNSNAGAPAEGKGLQDWKLGLPPELQEDASLKSIADVSALAKSYIHAQKLVGADKIPLPGKHATEDDWKTVYHKLGLPKKQEEYSLELKPGSVVDKDFLEKFKEAAYTSNVLPAQAQKLIDWMDNATKTTMEESVKQSKLKAEEEISGLRKEWGEAFDKNVSLARRALAKFADKETMAYLDSTGLGNDVRVIKLLSKAGELLKEDTVPGSSEPGPGVLTPAQAMDEYKKVMANLDHPYFKKDHPNHKSAVLEVQSLFKAAHSS